MSRSPSVIRAWVAAHHGVATFAALVTTTAALLVGADWLLPAPGQVRRLPLWQLTPVVLAMIAATASVNRMPGSTRLIRLGAARALWLATVTAVVSSCAAAVDLRTGLSATWPAAAVLTVLSFGTSPLLGRAAAWVGATAALAVLGHLQRYTGALTPWTWPGGVGGVALTVGLVLAVAGYLVGRADPSFPAG